MTYVVEVRGMPVRSISTGMIITFDDRISATRFATIVGGEVVTYGTHCSYR